MLAGRSLELPSPGELAMAQWYSGVVNPQQTSVLLVATWQRPSSLQPSCSEYLDRTTSARSVRPINKMAGLAASSVRHARTEVHTIILLGRMERLTERHSFLQYVSETPLTKWALVIAHQ